jgi:hypothetical protein
VASIDELEAARARLIVHEEAVQTIRDEVEEQRDEAVAVVARKKEIKTRALTERREYERWSSSRSPPVETPRLLGAQTSPSCAPWRGNATSSVLGFDGLPSARPQRPRKPRLLRRQCPPMTVGSPAAAAPLAVAPS